MNKCPVPRCEQSRKYDQVMCRDHWLMVPHDMQQEIWSSWRNRNRYYVSRAAFNKDHLALVARAVKAVREQASGPKDEYAPGEFRFTCKRGAS